MVAIVWVPREVTLALEDALVLGSSLPRTPFNIWVLHFQSL